MGLSWPTAVLLQDPSALGVWSLEMSEKTGLSQIFPHVRHTLLLEQWPGIVLPWSLIAVVAVLLPFLPKNLDLSLNPDRAAGIDPSSGRGSWSSPVLVSLVVGRGQPGDVLFLDGRQTELLRPLPARYGLADRFDMGPPGAGGPHSRRRGGGGPRDLAGPMGRDLCRGDGGPAGAPAVDPRGCLALVFGDRAGVGHFGRGQRSCLEARRRRLDPAPLSAACVAGIVVVYGIIAPAENSQRSHRALAQSLPRLIPAGVRTLMFFNEIDEGLWFYLNGLGLDVNLAPVPGCHPRYNLAYDLVENYRTQRLASESIADLEAKRQVHDKQALIAWLDHPDPSASPYLLIRNSLYERLAGDLAGRVAPLFRETGMKRNELVLLQVIGRRPAGASTSAIATTPGPTRR